MTQLSTIATAGARTARQPAEPSRPTLVGRWELLRLVGQGALARVYQARPAGREADSPACYALKMLREPWDEDPRGLEMLLREARLGRKVSHPHVVPVLAASVHEPPYFLVMPYLDGSTLALRLGCAERLSTAAALWIARQTAEGLAAIHAAGWMHADIKPANVFLSPLGHVTLVDLGFARKLDEAGSIANRPIMGTLNYMAPEMLTSALAADIRADIYSLGVTLFEMLTGRLPFHAPDLGTLLLEHRQGLPPDVRVLAPHLGVHVARLVRQMLAREPLRRPHSANDLVERLTKLEIETFAERMSA